MAKAEAVKQETVVGVTLTLNTREAEYLLNLTGRHSESSAERILTGGGVANASIYNWLATALGHG